jgi:hypothetical protein
LTGIAKPLCAESHTPSNHSNGWVQLCSDGSLRTLAGVHKSSCAYRKSH